ncbi:MAG: MFS transporter [Hyphomicrobiaceae bacterium]|nr:MFS transporter [Hyphomicrobiaceae bacterium]
MPALIRPITALLIATAIVLMGSGLIGVLLPLRAGVVGMSGMEIGLVGSAYWIGLTLGCLLAPSIIRRVGHIRAFVAFTASVTISPLMIALTDEAVAWGVLRVVNGACLAGIQMIIESWLSASATSETRGRIFAVYTILNLTVLTIGMQLVGLAPVSGFELFTVAAILFSLAAVPIALTASPEPPAPARAALDLEGLVTTSPSAVIAALSMGLTGGAFWSFAPLFGQAGGLDAVASAGLMTAAILTGALTQWPIGVLSDAFGRRQMLVVVTGLSALGALLLSAIATAGASPQALFTAAGIYGLVAFAGYPLALAHANDRVPKSQAIAISSGLMLTYAAGAMVGPLIAATMLDTFGATRLFYYSATIHATTSALILLRLRLRPVEREPFREEFVIAPRTTPAAYALDPRAEPPAAPPAGTPATPAAQPVPPPGTASPEPPARPAETR